MAKKSISTRQKTDLAGTSHLPVIVTGAAGFIGYRVVKSLLQAGYACIGVDYLDHFNDDRHAEHADVRLGTKLSLEALIDPDVWAAWAQAKQLPMAVIHMGACSDTTENRKDFIDRVNLNYSKSLWQLCTQYAVTLIYASSAATYGGGELGYDDNPKKMPQLKPLNLYGDSKLQFDLWALQETAAGRAPPAWSGFKFFNVYGFGERHKGRMASVVLQGFDQIRKQGFLRLFKSHRDGIADGEQKRDFVYVQDVVDVMLFAMNKPIKSGVYNLGSGQARSFKDLALATFQALRVPSKIEYVDTPLDIRDKYQYFTQAELDRLRSTGYTKPMTLLEDGVGQTVRDLLSQMTGKKASN
jgi:ADP-L-glycero-D-manno-heptose 6-epimerase